VSRGRQWAANAIRMPSLEDHENSSRKAGDRASSRTARYAGANRVVPSD